MRGLEQRFYDIVSAWARSIESKDPYTLGHCERVADYACAILRALDPDQSTLFWFRIGALLHDVGKINVPTEVLNKPGKLTPEERALMESHPVAGVELLKDVEFPWDVLPMVRSHHERWDGRGYPDRLTGEDIPLNARVLALADVFDALTTDRPYRPAFAPRGSVAHDARGLRAAHSIRRCSPYSSVLSRAFRLCGRCSGHSTRGQTSRGMSVSSYRF